MAYLVYISSTMRVSNISKILEEAHQTIERPTYHFIRRMMKHTKVHSDIKTKFPKISRVYRIVRIDDMSVDEVNAWLMTFCLDDETFKPVAFIESDQLITDAMDDIESQVSLSMQPFIDFLLLEVKKTFRKTKTFSYNAKLDIPYTELQKLVSLDRQCRKRAAKKYPEQYSTALLSTVESLL